MSTVVRDRHPLPEPICDGWPGQNAPESNQGIGPGHTAPATRPRLDLQDGAGENGDHTGEFFDNGAKCGADVSRRVRPCSGSRLVTNRSQSVEARRRNEAKLVVEGVATERSQIDPVRGRICLTKQSHRSGWCGYDRFRLEARSIWGCAGSDGDRTKPISGSQGEAPSKANREPGGILTERSQSRRGWATKRSQSGAGEPITRIERDGPVVVPIALMRPTGLCASGRLR